MPGNRGIQRRFSPVGFGRRRSPGPFDDVGGRTGERPDADRIDAVDLLAAFSGNRLAVLGDLGVVRRLGIGVWPTRSLQINGGLAIKDGVTAPSTLSGFGQIFIDSADGDLKITFGDGTTKTIVVDT